MTLLKATNAKKALVNLCFLTYLGLCLLYFQSTSASCEINYSIFIWNTMTWILVPLIAIRLFMNYFVNNQLKFEGLSTLLDIHCFFSFGFASISGFL